MFFVLNRTTITQMNMLKSFGPSILLGLAAALSQGWAQAPATNAPSAGSEGKVTHLPAVTVTGTSELKEEMPMGPNQQPEWTARRRFATTRVYIQPPWQVETELGWDATFPRHGKAEHLLQQEIELGLPYRFQFDVENSVQNFEEGDDSNRDWHHDSNSVELRYALADWDKIPLNPTLKAEWRFNDGTADAYELALQLGDELAPRWHWGMDLFFEQQIGDDRRREYAVSQAVSYTLIDEKLGVGAEMLFSSETDKDSRSDPENKFEIGPSVQWRTSSRTHLDVVPLFGTTSDSPTVELFVFFGIEFGPGSKESEGVSPASLRGK
jgi:hypothetical protein